MKRFLFSIIFISMIILLFAGCKKKNKVTTIQFFHYKQEYTGQMNEIVSLFQKKYPDIVIEVESIPGDPRSILRPRFENSDITPPDIMMLPSSDIIYEYAKSGYLVDISKEWFMGKIYNPTKNRVTFRNRIYGYPLNVKGIGIIYKKDIFMQNKIEPPLSFTKLKENCDILKKNKIIPFYQQTKNNKNTGYLFSMAHSSSFGFNLGDIKNWNNLMDEGKETFKSQKVENVFKILDFYKTNLTLKNNGGLSKDQTSDFNSGNFAMVLDEINLNDKNNFTDTGFFPFPFLENDPKLFYFVDSYLAISSKSSVDKIEASKKFLDFFTSEQVLKILVEECNMMTTIKNSEVSKKNINYQTFYKYFQDEKVVYCEYLDWDTKFYEKSKKIMMDYFKDKISINIVLKQLDEEWKKSKEIQQ